MCAFSLLKIFYYKIKNKMYVKYLFIFTCNLLDYAPVAREYRTRAVPRQNILFLNRI